MDRYSFRVSWKAPELVVTGMTRWAKLGSRLQICRRWQWSLLLEPWQYIFPLLAQTASVITYAPWEIVEPASRFVIVNGKRVHYVESRIAGSRDALLLLHGKSFKAETWSSIGAPGRINEMGLDYVAVDYPGWGESDENGEFYPPTRKYSNAATFIEEFSRSTGLKKFSLLGASFSGPFAVSYASRHPESVNKLVLVGPVWSEDLSQETSLIRKPVLIMYGENDNVIPLESFLRYNRSIKRSTLRPVRKAGHALYLDNREEFFNELDGFLRS